MPQFKTGLKMSDFQEGTLVRRDINGKSIVFAKINDKLFAMDSVCSHEGGPLEDGSLDGYNLTCPWHQGIFDIRNAKASPDTSWVTDLQSYTVIVEEKTAEISQYGFGPFESSKEAEIEKEPSQDEKTSPLDEQNPLPKRPLKLELSLSEKTSIAGTDIMSFKFSRTDAQNHLNYKAGQYSVVDLGTKRGSRRTHQVLYYCLFSFRRFHINEYTDYIHSFQKEVSKHGHWISCEDNSADGRICFTPRITRTPWYFCPVV